MKIPINRNSFWSELFTAQLSQSGIKYACISPGSRSTPLTLAFASNKKIKTFVNPDERSNAFFALGLAEHSGSPVAIVTTSGTAVAELYPAIIEAYQRRIPLIVCTADRPPELLNCGANQTINQENIFANHIRKFFNAGLPSLNESKLLKIKKIAAEAVEISLKKNQGPVHVNFPFRKPLEPESFTDKIDKHFYDKIRNINLPASFSTLPSVKQHKKVMKAITGKSKGLIFCGWDNYRSDFPKLLVKFSRISGFPIIADGISGLRFGKHSMQNIISNASAFLKSKAYGFLLEAEIILQFGSAPTSNIVLDFLKKSQAEKFLINEYGDYKDPSRTARNIIKINPSEFLSELLTVTKNVNHPRNNRLNKIRQFEQLTEKIKEQNILNAEFPFEGRIIPEVLKSIPPNSNLFVSNSMPVRDLDFFSSAMKKNIKIYSNRGASGIDGIISTAAGIAVKSKFPTYLVIGDLAFLHDSNGLNILQNQKIPLQIILIDNNGGGIFGMLPIAKNKKYFEEYFQTPQTADFALLTKAHGGKYYRIKSWNMLKNTIFNYKYLNNFSVLHVKTNAEDSIALRKKYWEVLSGTIESQF